MQLTNVDLSLVHPDPDNIRDSAHDADIEALAESIRARGLLQPIVVYAAGDDDGVSPGHYLISAGHRRFFALLLLGHTAADVYVREHPRGDLERLDLMGDENLQRRQLNPLEEAKFYQRYIRAGLTQGEVAQRAKVTPVRVSEYLMLLSLSADVQRRLVAGEITVSQAKKVARQVRHAAGQARQDYGGQHHAGVAVPHFTARHKLYQVAAARCRQGEHDPALRIGAACGACWEHAIRVDAQKSPALTNEAPEAPRRQVERFSDPRDILRRIKCTRCDVGALDRPNERRCSTLRGGRRVLFDRHEFPMEVTADV